MLWPIAASVPAQSISSRGRDLPIRLAWSDRGGRTSFCWRWPACLGWSLGLWAVPLVAFALLETAWTVAEWARERDADAAATPYVR